MNNECTQLTTSTGLNIDCHVAEDLTTHLPPELTCALQCNDVVVAALPTNVSYLALSIVMDNTLTDYSILIDKPHLDQTHGTPLGTHDVLDLQFPRRCRRRLRISTLTTPIINDYIRHQLPPLGDIALPRIRQQHHLQVLRAHHALNRARHDADGRRHLVHDDDATMGRHGGDDLPEDLQAVFVRVVVHDHAQEIDGGVADGLRRVEVVGLEGEAGPEVGRDHARGWVEGARDDLGQVLYDYLEGRVGERDGDGAVAYVAGDVDDDAVGGEFVPGEPARRVRVGHDREGTHVGHELGEALADPGLPLALVVRVHGQVGLAGEIQPGFVGVWAAVPEVFEGLDLLDGHGEHVARDVGVERRDARVGYEELGRGRVGDVVRRRFVEDVDLDQLPQHLAELFVVERELGGEGFVADAVVERDRRRDRVVVDVVERVEVVGLI